MTISFRNIETQELQVFETVYYVSNRDGSFMIIDDTKYPKFLDSKIWELWRLH